jgi:hypothetical protein
MRKTVLWKMTLGVGTHQTTETQACWSSIFSELELELELHGTKASAVGVS